MKCVTCGIGIDEGVTLFRQNEKGVVGVWSCEQHNKVKVEDDVAELVAIIEKGVNDE